MRTHQSVSTSVRNRGELADSHLFGFYAPRPQTVRLIFDA